MLFPIKDNEPTSRTPYLTIGLIVLNTLIFLYSRLPGPEHFVQFIHTFGFKPAYYMAALQGAQIPDWYLLTPITSMFLHGDWMHIIGNMLFLWIFGNNIEDYFGPVKFIIFYILAGLFAVLLFSLPNLDSQTPLVGASGAISGIMGAYIVLHPRAEITCLFFFFFIQFIVLPAKVMLGFWFALQLFMSLVGQGGAVAYLAHVGGFVFGWLILKAIVKMKGGGTGRRGGQRVYRVEW